MVKGHWRMDVFFWFRSWYKYTDIEQFTSMEQLWLAFVMKEKYQKLWEEGEWVIAPKGHNCE